MIACTPCEALQIEGIRLARSSFGLRRSGTGTLQVIRNAITGRKPHVHSFWRDIHNVVMVSSAGHRRADVDLDDPNFERSPYNEYLAYGRSKTATILFAVEFDQRYKSKGIRATAVHPGAIQTETVQKMIEALGAGRDAAVAAYEWKTVPQGAATSVWAACVAPAGEIGAKYCEDCHVADVVDDPSAKTGVRSYALDPDHAKALWVKGEEMVGEHFPVQISRHLSIRVPQ